MIGFIVGIFVLAITSIDFSLDSDYIPGLVKYNPFIFPIFAQTVPFAFSFSLHFHAMQHVNYISTGIKVIGLESALWMRSLVIAFISSLVSMIWILILYLAGVDLFYYIAPEIMLHAITASTLFTMCSRSEIYVYDKVNSVLPPALQIRGIYKDMKQPGK